MSSVSNDPWRISVKQPSGGGDRKYVLCPEGGYFGYIVGIYDVGHHTKLDEKTGKSFVQQTLVLVYEITSKAHDGGRWTLAQKYTWSMDPKANFRKLVSNITGWKPNPALGPGYEEFYDPRELVGLPVMITITHSFSKDGSKTYHNLGVVSRVPDGIKVPRPLTPKTIWTIADDEPLPEVTDSFPFIYGVSIRQMVDDSIEAREKRQAVRETGVVGESRAIIDITDDDEDNDIPF